MGTLKYFSEGIGLIWLVVGIAALLGGIVVWVRRSRMKHYLGNIIIPSFLMILSLVFLALTFEFRDEEAGPAVVPRLYVFLILVLCAVILSQIFRGRDKAVPRIEHTGLLIAAMASLIGYFIAMPFLGYFLSSFLFIVLMLKILNYQKKGLMWLIAGGWVVASYFLFYKLLYIQLPLGPFEGLF